MSLVCGVCNENPSKYKCPVCRLRYCSAPCYKLHKDAACGQPAAPATQAPATSSPEATPVPTPSAIESMPMPLVSEMTEAAPMPTDILESSSAALEPTRNADSVIAAVSAIVEDAEAAAEAVLAAEPSDVDAMAVDPAERPAADTNVIEMVDEALAVPALIADDDDEANIHLLTKAQLQAIASSTLVRKALDNPHFRSRIQEIDSHADRLLELQKALTDPSFAQFVYGMMDEVRDAGP